MSILSNKSIVDELGLNVVIDPYDPRNVNTSSYDVTLGEYYYSEQNNDPDMMALIYNIYDEQAVSAVWGRPKRAEEVGRIMMERLGPYQHGISPGDKIIMLHPQHTILAHTQEFIGGRGNITTMMKARSSFGRNFIEVCKCAGYGDIGYINRWTMEITNNSRIHHIPLVVGRRIAQIVFMWTGPLTEADSSYASTGGNYQDTDDIEELKRRWEPSMMLPRLHLDRDIAR